MTEFDFSVLGKKAIRRRRAEPEMLSVFESLVNSAPRKLGIKEIMSVAEASGLEVPKENTMRNWLNRLVEEDRISKPSRQFYAAAGTPQENDEDDDDEDVNDLEDDDPEDELPDDEDDFSGDDFL